MKILRNNLRHLS